MLINGIKTKWHRPLACAPRRDAWATFSGEEGNGHFRNEVLGLGYKVTEGEGTVPRLNPRRPFIKDLDAHAFRLDFGLVDVPRYFTKAGTGKYQKVFTYKTSRGCPFNCGFCYNVEFNQRRWRAKSAERVIEDISLLKSKYGVDGVKFYDDEFYVDRRRAIRILEGIGIPAKTDIRIDMITDDLAARIKEFQVFDLLVGIESGSDRMLKLYSKGFTVEDIKSGVEILARHNLRVGYSAILGAPTETAEEKEATIDLLLWIHGIHKNKTITLGPYLPYPGSALYAFCLEQGFVPPKRTEDWGIMDRWTHQLRLPWVEDDTAYWIREYMKFFDYGIPLLSKIAEARLRHRVLSIPADVAVINWLYEQAIQERNWFGKTLRKAHRRLRAS